MNTTALVLASAFVAIAVPFLVQAKKEGDPVNARNKRLVGGFFMLAAAGFGAAFAVSVARG